MQIVLKAFVNSATLHLKQKDAITIIAQVNKLVLLPLRKSISEASKKELDELRKQYNQEKGYNVLQIYECDRWKS